ncbi:MAG: prepilin-type N-terminal cleavage/methylation domain-containing protein [Candidatus Falkowbacteria bacterium]|nr:prepilin-type N-terminal cleavage/methylation domain-containing protein [Candidatus Falkowbacteria bacterium]
MRFIFSHKKGFTLIELLVVIAIIGVLSTMAIIALGNARAKARDSKRVADIKQISTALELYYADNNSYPTIITPGNSIVSPDGTKTYMATIPNNPTPRNDSGCGDNNYTYASTPDNTNYSLNFCLGNNVSSTPAGINSSSSTGVGTAPGLVGWWKFDEGSGTTASDSSGNNNIGTLVSSPSWQTSADCKNGGCIKFNGSGDYVNIPYNTNLDTPSGTTISFWAKYVLAAGNHEIIRRSSVFFIRAIEGGGTYTIPYVYADFPRGYTGCAFTDNVWFHFVQIYDPINDPELKSYKNGVLAGADPWLTGAMPSVATPITIGGDNSGWSLSVDDVRIYNRALSAAEVLALYNSIKP